MNIGGWTMDERLYGLLARFPDTSTLLAASRDLRRRGLTRLDAYSPHPVEGLSDALGLRERCVPVIALLCATLAGGITLTLQVYGSLDYPFNAGGKPVVSWPAYMIVTFAMTMVGATLGSVLSMLWLNGFPRPYHPLFNVAAFDAASRDGYFLCLEAGDPLFDAERLREHLSQHGAVSIHEVPA